MAIELSAAQKKLLRSRGQTLSPTCTVGKAGLSEAAVANIDALLDQHELIKVRLAEAQGPQRAAMASELAEHTNSSVVGVVGKNLLLYRANEEIEPRKRIHLPR
jgi:RNA-binding protein